MLCADEATSEAKEKIGPFLDMMLEKFEAAFYPYRDIAIYEMVIGFKGRWVHKQYNASKPHQYHIKAFGLCDSITGDVINLKIYFGKNTSYNPDSDPNSQQAVKVLKLF